ncbi:uridine diphosphate glucose pyrophosphatase NUDT14-like isoform X2 [Hydractinia symbiolongicarpus]|nr:uridine diphosphate glucose pyrophosphatase NUDT14-like isoform X2 [Hydractinia symbiolongicarpus]
MNGLEIKDMKVVPCVDSRFIAPTRVTFSQNGFKRHWDYIKAHDSVAILLFNTTRQAFVLVKQFRPALYMNINTKESKRDITMIGSSDNIEESIVAPFERGVSYELCAGIVDKQVPLVEIAQSELLEETGYQVPLDKIQRLFKHNAVGYAGNCGTLYYAEVTDDMKVAEGGGNSEEGEFIELFYLPLKEARNFVFNDDYAKPASFIAAFCWFFMTRGM